MIAKAAPRTIGGVLRLSLLGLALFVVVVAALAIGLLFATGTLRHTDEGWVYRSPFGSGAGQISGELDARLDTIFFEQGSGSTQTRQFAATRKWVANWGYSCESPAASFRLVVSREGGQTYPAGAIEHNPNGSGQSDELQAGSYSLTVTTDPGCSWRAGARPNQ